MTKDVVLCRHLGVIRSASRSSWVPCWPTSAAPSTGSGSAT